MHTLRAQVVSGCFAEFSSLDGRLFDDSQQKLLEYCRRELGVANSIREHNPTRVSTAFKAWKKRWNPTFGGHLSLWLRDPGLRDLEDEKAAAKWYIHTISDLALYDCFRTGHKGGSPPKFCPKRPCFDANCDFRHDAPAPRKTVEAEKPKPTLEFPLYYGGNISKAPEQLATACGMSLETFKQVARFGDGQVFSTHPKFKCAATCFTIRSVMSVGEYLTRKVGAGFPLIADVGPEPSTRARLAAAHYNTSTPRKGSGKWCVTEKSVPLSEWTTRFQAITVLKPMPVEYAKYEDRSETQCFEAVAEFSPVSQENITGDTPVCTYTVNTREGDTLPWPIYDFEVHPSRYSLGSLIHKMPGQPFSAVTYYKIPSAPADGPLVGPWASVGLVPIVKYGVPCVPSTEIHRLYSYLKAADLSDTRALIRSVTSSFSRYNIPSSKLAVAVAQMQVVSRSDMPLKELMNYKADHGSTMWFFCAMLTWVLARLKLVPTGSLRNLVHTRTITKGRVIFLMGLCLFVLSICCIFLKTFLSETLAFNLIQIVSLPFAGLFMAAGITTLMFGKSFIMTCTLFLPADTAQSLLDYLPYAMHPCDHGENVIGYLSPAISAFVFATYVLYHNVDNPVFDRTVEALYNKAVEWFPGSTYGLTVARSYLRVVCELFVLSLIFNYVVPVRAVCMPQHWIHIILTSLGHYALQAAVLHCIWRLGAIFTTVQKDNELSEVAAAEEDKWDKHATLWITDPRRAEEEAVWGSALHSRSYEQTDEDERESRPHSPATAPVVPTTLSDFIPPGLSSSSVRARHVMTGQAQETAAPQSPVDMYAADGAQERKVRHDPLGSVVPQIQQMVDATAGLRADAPAYEPVTLPTVPLDTPPLDWAGVARGQLEVLTRPEVPMTPPSEMKQAVLASLADAKDADEPCPAITQNYAIESFVGVVDTQDVETALQFPRVITDSAGWRDSLKTKRGFYDKDGAVHTLPKRLSMPKALQRILQVREGAACVVRYSRDGKRLIALVIKETNVLSAESILATHPHSLACLTVSAVSNLSRKLRR
jgi:hypothetical protein